MSYTPTEWASGDVVTAAKLNHIEGGIVDLNTDVAALDAGDIAYDSSESYNANTVGSAIGDVKSQMSDVGSEVIRYNHLLGGNINNLKLEDGSIDISTGENTPNSSRARSAGYLEVDPNTNYTIDYESIKSISGTMWVLGYDSEKKVITDGSAGGYTSTVFSASNGSGGGTFKTTATTKYLRWYDTANIDRSTPITIVCSESWKKDVDTNEIIISKDRMLIVGTSYPVITELKNGTILVDFPSESTFYFLASTGTQVKAKTFSAGTSFTVGANEVLAWALDTNTVSVIGNNTTRTNTVILLNNYNGKAQNGELKQYIDNDRPKIKNINTVCASYKAVSSSITVQGMTVVKDVIWGFSGSNDAHSNTAKITLKSRTDFEQITQITHNLGHCPSADYSVKTDTVIVCNGSTDPTTLPELYLIKNASAYNSLTGQTIEYDDTNAVIAIDVSDIGGYGLVGCFGEKENIVYLATKQTNYETLIFKCLLGMGAVDYSESGYGTLISDTPDDEYNGTLKILNKYSGVPLDVFQGMCFHNGAIYMALDNNVRKEAKIVGIRLFNEANYEITNEHMIVEYDTDGEIVYYEPEGLCILDGIYFLTNLAKTGNNKMIIMPIGNEQGGTGEVGTAVTFPFPCNMTPNVFITPLSNVTMYVSAVSNTGFTVSGSGSGTFVWRCAIS